MPSEPLNDTPTPPDVIDPDQKTEDAGAPGAELPVELSQFSQRLASFGLGETPDPLLTELRPPSKRRPRR
jgi:hypothetical protein